MPSELNLEFEFGGRRFRDAVRGLDVLQKRFGRTEQLIPRALGIELTNYMDAVRRALIRRHSNRWQPGGSEPDRLYRRRGSIRDIKVSTTSGATIDSLKGEITVPFPLSVHEDGATIVPRRARYLTVPTEHALDSRGVPILPRARDWPNTFVQTSRRGNLLIFQKRGGQIIPLYVLKKVVTLPPRLKAQETLDAGAQGFIDAAVERVANLILDAVP